MTRIEKQCLCVKIHNPKPSDGAGELHHIFPKQYGGLTVPDNLVWLCAIAHNNIHIRIRTGKGGNRYQIKIAEEGIARILVSHGHAATTQLSI